MSTTTYRPLKAIRKHCLDCCGDNSKAVMWCGNDGIHSTRCDLWPYRFGIRPESARQRYGVRLVTPGLMPDANTNLDDLPGTGVKEAAKADGAKADAA
jgi:hypothetical protein